LLPFLKEETREKMLYYGWQAAAALISISGKNKNAEIDLSGEIDQTKVIKRAVESNEVHAIKFTEACLREYKLNPNPVYIHAINEIVNRLT